jgi:hypothetical protein
MYRNHFLKQENNMQKKFLLLAYACALLTLTPGCWEKEEKPQDQTAPMTQPTTPVAPAATAIPAQIEPATAPITADTAPIQNPTSNN